MHKTKLRDEAHGAADGGDQSIVRCCGCGECAVNIVGHVPVGRRVIAAFPGDAVLFAELLVDLFNASAFHAA